MGAVKAEILTPYSSGRYPAVGESYFLLMVTDITGIPSKDIIPVLNTYSVVVKTEESTLAQIEQDSNYFVVWSELDDSF